MSEANDTKRDSRFFIRLSNEESRALLVMSAYDGRHPREQLRHLLREAARQRGLLPDEKSE